MAASCLTLAVFCFGAGLLLLWAALFSDGQTWLEWQTQTLRGLRGLQTVALQKLQRRASFLGWQSTVLQSGADYRRLSACPIFARNPEADSNGDCVCPRDRPACYQGGEKWCLRNDGVRDFHFFSMSCETCTCQKDTDSGDESEEFVPLETCSAEGLAEGTRPNKLGQCTCPTARPMCVTVTDLIETPGCSLGPPDNELDPTQFDSACTNCACRQTCPENSRQTFADSFGDCACPEEVPICYEDGLKGCRTSSVAVVDSNSYFRASCGKACTCRIAVGACEPATCITSTDCEYEACYDCEMCLGISKCPDVGILHELPNANGNCQCDTELSCFQGTNELPGCPIAPFGESSTSFRANCRGCYCDVLKTGSVLLGLQCPPFAKEELPDRYGDCVCPADAADCWEDGQKWCTRNDQRRDLRYFSVRCSTCECREAPAAAELSRMQPCPDFARDELSDAYRNCACPPAKPLCVEGEWETADQSGDESATQNTNSEESKRIGPMCKTTHGWLSSTHFRYDCEDCHCMEVEGEGSRLRKIRPDELTQHDGNSYMKHHLVVDLRVINSYDTVTDWQEAYDDIATSASQEYARGVEGGLSYLDIASAAVVEVIELQDTRVYSDPNLEEVHVMRVYVEFGVMWAEGEERRLVATDAILKVSSSNNSLTSAIRQAAQLVDRHTLEAPREMQAPTLSSVSTAWWSNSSLTRALREDKEIKKVEELTPRETFLLLNFASIFNEALFAEELEMQIWNKLNVTWEWRIGNGTVSGPLVEAPRVEVTRMIVGDQAQLPELSWIGPLAQLEPERRFVDRNTGAVEEEGVPVGAVIGILVTILFACGCCICTCYGCHQRRKEMIRQREMNMVRIGGKNDSPRDTDRGKSASSPTGSPRAQVRGGGRQSQVPQAGRYSLAARHKREEVANSILMGGGSGGGGGGGGGGAPASSRGGMFNKLTGRGGKGGDDSPSASPRAMGSVSARGSRLRDSAETGRESEAGRRSSDGGGLRRGSESPTGRDSQSPRGRASQSANKNRRASSKEARPVIDRKLMKRMGDLAGHKALSEQAKAALEADYEKKQGEMTKKGRASVGANVFGRGRQSQVGARKSKGGDSPPRESKSISPGSSESDESPEGKRERSIRISMAEGKEGEEVGEQKTEKEKSDKKHHHHHHHHHHKKHEKPKSRCRRFLACLFFIIKKIFSIFLLPLRLLRRCICALPCCKRCRRKEAEKSKSKRRKKGDRT